MFKPSYKDWPKGYHRLLHYTIILMVVSLAALWLGVFPRWRNLESLREQNEQKRAKLEKSGVLLDPAMLKQHIEECRAALTFRNEIHNVYPSDEPHGLSPEDQFVYNSTRIDYKDLSDRIKSEFKEKNIIITEKCFETDTAEPVFHLMLKLWVIRILLHNALDNSLAVEAEENGEARISATRTFAYAIGSDTAKPYLLEFPVSIHLTGTMENFLKFIKSLQEKDLYLPLKHIRVYSEPPKELPPGAKIDVSQLHFRASFSSFFPAPSSNTLLNVEGGTKEN